MIALMRVDKYLKVSRLIKRREVAKELADAGYVKVNGKDAKPSCEIVEGDEITLRLGKRTLTVKVTSLLPHAGKEKALTMYEVTQDERDNRGTADA